MVEIRIVNPKLTLQQLENFQDNHKISFPIEYKDFLLKYNGGYPQKSAFKVKDGIDEFENILNVFYGINSINDDLSDSFDFFDDIIELGFLPIADDPGGNQICIGINNEFYQKIYFWDHETEIKLENLQFVADSFQEFLNDLTE